MRTLNDCIHDTIREFCGPIGWNGDVQTLHETHQAALAKTIINNMSEREFFECATEYFTNHLAEINSSDDQGNLVLEGVMNTFLFDFEDEIQEAWNDLWGEDEAA